MPAASPRLPMINAKPVPRVPPEVPSLLPLAQRTRLAEGQRLLTTWGDAAAPRQLVWHLWAPEQPVPGAAPVVLFHGGSGSWTHWVKNIPAPAAASVPSLWRFEKN